jgi:hypothetical protein
MNNDFISENLFDDTTSDGRLQKKAKPGLLKQDRGQRVKQTVFYTWKKFSWEKERPYL